MPSSKQGAEITKISIPRSLYMSLIRIQADENLDLDEACNRAAELIESNSKKFKEAIKRESNRIYKSRFMTEINKAKDTWYSKGYKEGDFIGSTLSKAKHQVWYYCAICGERIDISPDSESHKDIIEYMRERGWKHVSCQKK